MEMKTKNREEKKSKKTKIKNEKRKKREHHVSIKRLDKINLYMVSGKKSDYVYKFTWV